MKIKKFVFLSGNRIPRMMLELASHNKMIGSAGRWTWFDVTCNSDDFLWNSVEPEESSPRIQKTQI